MLEKEDRADYLDIQYIARRSNNDYTWPTMLIITFALNISWAIYCAIRLPIEARAESLRLLRAILVPSGGVGLWAQSESESRSDNLP